MAVERIDWWECPLVEVESGVQSGAPVLLGTRMPVDTIADNFDYGVSVAEIVERVTALRIVFDKNVPVGVRRFLTTRGAQLRRDAVASAA
jgi:hypothetical protein